MSNFDLAAIVEVALGPSRNRNEAVENRDTNLVSRLLCDFEQTCSVGRMEPILKLLNCKHYPRNGTLALQTDSVRSPTSSNVDTVISAVAAAMNRKTPSHMESRPVTIVSRSNAITAYR